MRWREHDGDQNVQIRMTKFAQTDKSALLSRHGEAEAVWLPLSQISMDDLDVPEQGEPIEGVLVDIPHWLARREGLA